MARASRPETSPVPKWIESQIRSEEQLNPVADKVSAITAVVRPILTGILYSLKSDVVAEAGGRESVKLKMLPRLRRQGDGDTGICFEYAVHDAVSRGDQAVLERVGDALSLCKVPGGDVGSILFGAEKAGSQQLIDAQVVGSEFVLNLSVGPPGGAPENFTYLEFPLPSGHALAQGRPYGNRYANR